MRLLNENIIMNAPAFIKDTLENLNKKLLQNCFTDKEIEHLYISAQDYDFIVRRYDYYYGEKDIKVYKVICVFDSCLCDYYSYELMCVKFMGQNIGFAGSSTVFETEMQANTKEYIEKAKEGVNYFYNERTKHNEILVKNDDCYLYMYIEKRNDVNMFHPYIYFILHDRVYRLMDSRFEYKQAMLFLSQIKNDGAKKIRKTMSLLRKPINKLTEENKNHLRLFFGKNINKIATYLKEANGAKCYLRQLEYYYFNSSNIFSNYIFVSDKELSKEDKFVLAYITSDELPAFSASIDVIQKIPNCVQIKLEHGIAFNSSNFGITYGLFYKTKFGYMNLSNGHFKDYLPLKYKNALKQLQNEYKDRKVLMSKLTGRNMGL